MSGSKRRTIDLKKLMAVLISAAMAFAMMPILAAPVFAEDGQNDPLSEYVNGYIPFEYTYKIGNKKMVKDTGTVRSDSPSVIGIKSTESSLPERYRSDIQPWAEGVRVKDQYRTSLCWAFAMTSAAEYSYAKEVYEKTGTVWTVQELSPGHLGQFHYNRVNDPLGNTVGDSNDVPAGASWPLYGGNDIFAMQTWASWSGAALEDKYPISKINSHILKDKNYSDVWDGQDIVYPAAGAYDDELTMQESIVLFHPVMNTMKELILKYGAITGSMEFDYKNYMNLDEIDPDTGKPYLGGRSYYNYNDSFSANHAVTLVGWDDNYPKENFTHVIESEVEKAKEEARETAEGEARARAEADAEQSYNNLPLAVKLITNKQRYIQNYVDEHLDDYIEKIIDEAGEEAAEASKKKTTPAKNGAWIMQNSWSSDVHDDGFVYVSYEDIDFNTEISDLYAFDMQKADTYTYNFQYDGNALSTDSSDRTAEGNHLDYYTKPGTRAANVYRNTTKNYIKLGAVGYTTFTTGEQAYDVSVYTGLKDKKSPTSGKFCGTTRVTTSTRGCKTADLDRAVYVAPGETFSIVFDFTDFSAFGIETSASSPYFLFEAETKPGQSFFSKSKSSKWVDMDEYDACFRIKAYANPTKAPQAVNISQADVSGVTSKPYTGSAITQKAVLSYEGNTLIEGTDYEISYSDNTNAGTAVMTIKGKGGFTGSRSITFSITPRMISPAVVLSQTDLTYNKKAQAPSVTVMDGGNILPASQYVITYSKGRKDVGEYGITVTLKGNYSGEGTATYSIVPKGTRLSGLSAARKAANAKWKKQSAMMSKSVINGYQLQYSTDPTFNTGAKTATVKEYKKTSRKLKGLEAKKKYYVRIRTYKTVGNKNYYSGWSKAKTVKTK